MTARKYILLLSLFTAIISIAVVALNYFVDSYGIIGSPRIEGFNKHKTDINSYVRLSKRYQPLQKEYNALIVGNSRVELGMNPGHLCFRQAGWSVYNLGLPGAGVRQQLEYALNVIYQQPIRKVWLSVDFIDFAFANKDSQEKRAALDEMTESSLRYLPSGDLNPDYLTVKMFDYFKALFSLDAAISSFATLAGQVDPTTDRDLQGFNPAHDFARAVHIEGPSALFDQKMSLLRKQYSTRLYLRTRTGRLGQSFNDLAWFLAFAEERGIQVTVFMNPFHEEYWTLLQREAMMPLYIEWSVEIARLIRKRGGANLSLWDFSGDSDYIHEPVPQRGQKSGALQWFWEPAHYRAQLGDLMIDSMLSGSCSREAVFGVQII